MSQAELRLLGAPDLVLTGGSTTNSVLAQPRRLALLAYLCLAQPRGFHRRDALAALFWPDSDQAHARALLRNGIFHLRQTLGAEALPARGDDEVGVDFAILQCDAVRFENLVRSGQLEQAIAVYGGDLLPGFFVPGAAGFEEWLDRERSRLNALAAATCMKLAKAAPRATEAIGWAERAHNLSPWDETLLRQFLVALARSGNHARALGLHDDFARRLRSEFGADPSPETRALVQAIQSRTLDQAPAVDLAGVPEADVPWTFSSRARPRFNRTAMAGTALAIAAVSLATTFIAAPDTDVRSVAVLPCQYTGAQVMGASTDRWTEELIHKLVRVGGLRPTAFAAVRRFGAFTGPDSAIAAQLNATSLVRCRVAELPSGTRLEIVLTRFPDQQLTWTRAYFRGPDPYAASSLQAQAARDIAIALGVPPDHIELATLARPLSQDSMALRQYRQARTRMASHDIASMQQAMRLLDSAVTRDSAFALAVYALAQATTWHGELSQEPIGMRQSRVHALLQRAVDLDGLLSGAHSWLAMSHLEGRYDWANAERMHRRAIELEPGSAEAHLWYGYHLWLARRFGEAIDEYREAATIDPGDIMIAGHLVRALVSAGRDDEARAEIIRMITRDSTWRFSYDMLAQLLIRRGDPDSALKVLERLEQLSPDRMAYEGWAHAAAGNPGRARAMLDSLQRLARTRPVDPSALAWIQAGLGLDDAALSSLERAFAERGEWLLALLGPAPAFDHLRNDARFRALQARAGLPQ